MCLVGLLKLTAKANLLLSTILASKTGHPICKRITAVFEFEFILIKVSIVKLAGLKLMVFAGKVLLAIYSAIVSVFNFTCTLKAVPA